MHNRQTTETRGVRNQAVPIVLALCLATVAVVVPAIQTASAAVPVLTGHGETAARHLRLLRSDPMADSTVATAPRAISLWFSQRPELAVTTLRLTGPNGAVAVGRATFGAGAGAAAPVVVPITAPVAPGRYTVAWRTMAPDGHLITGEFAFTVAPRRAPAEGA